VRLQTPNSGSRNHLPILLLLAISIPIGILTFKDYGLTWDEPLFYDYAKALGYAYSPAIWFSGEFNLDNAFGSSASDHANRGPAYLLLARQPAAWLEALGLDMASAWHLVNFLTFQVGVYGLYVLCLHWMRPWPAFSAAVLFASQPLLWGHSFINSKDIPFLVFFILSIWSGLTMVDALVLRGTRKKQLLLICVSGALVGLTTSIRVLGPLAGLLIILYGLSQFWSKRSSLQIDGSAFLRVILLPLFSYLIVSILVMFVTWPYLWPDPIKRFLEVFQFMSANPTELAVLFNGVIFHADELPRRYLPTLLILTLTEPTWPLFFIGTTIGLMNILKIKDQKTPSEGQSPSKTPVIWLLLAWFLYPFLYVIIRKPPIYDGYRHFLFMLPPVFILAGIAFDKLFDLFQPKWVYFAFISLVLCPGVLGIFQLHPYEYTYYNSYIGGVNGAFRRYETDYWLTCYKEAIGSLEAVTSTRTNLFVRREPAIAAYYASGNLSIRDYRLDLNEIQSGDYYLVNTRSNEDRKAYRDAAITLAIGREGADFCYIKKIP